MRQRTLSHILVVCLAVLLVAPSLFAQQLEDPDKRAQSGFKFLTVTTDAHAAGMGNAMTAQEMNSSAMFANPATMAWMPAQFSVGVGQTQWIADVTYNAGSAAYNTPVGVFGLMGVMVEYGDFEETVRYNNEAGYLDLGTYSPKASVFGVGYSRGVTDRFAVGAVIKYATQDLGEATLSLDGETPEKKAYKKNVVVYDFGVVYHTGFESLTLAMVARNFSRELEYAEENFELPLSFRVGLSMNLVDLTSLNPNQHSLLLSIDTERPRDYYEQIKIGAEYTFMNMLAVRAGYVTPHDEAGLSAGFGIKDLMGLSVDYAYSDFGIFGAVNRFSVKYQF